MSYHQTEDSKMKIYFMYNYVDERRAEAKIEELKKTGLDVWHFPSDYQRKKWKHIAKTKIKECNYVCYFFNKEAFLQHGKNIIWEYKTAQKYGKKVIFIDGNEPTPIEDLIIQEDNVLLKNLFNESFSGDKLMMKNTVESFEKAQNKLKYQSSWNANEQVIQPNNSSLHDSDFSHILFEQYKLMVETSETLIERRQNTSNIYTGIITALLTLVGSSFALANRIATGIIFFAVGLMTIVLSINWKVLLNNYAKNNEGKFAVINAIEKELPANLFDAEYTYNKLKSIGSYASREVVLCNIFTWLGSFIAGSGLVIFILALCQIL